MKKGHKNFPKELVRETLEKGDAAFYSNSKGMLSVKYCAEQNKSGNKPKVVHMLSTLHKANMVDTGKTDKDKNLILKPSCILDYNHQMGVWILIVDNNSLLSTPCTKPINGTGSWPCVF